MQKIIIGESHHAGKMVEIEEMEEEASKVRICRGFEGAGQVLWVNNSEIEWGEQIDNGEKAEKIHEEKKPRFHLPETPIDWIKYIVAGIAILALIIKLVSWAPGAIQDSKVRQAVNELNTLNTLDATDVELRNQAQERINSRAERKKELIKTINFIGTP